MAEIVGAAINTVKQGANYVSETLAGNTSEAQAKVNKEEMKSGETSIGQKVDALGDYASNKSDEASHKGKAEVEKQKLQN